MSQDKLEELKGFLYKQINSLQGRIDENLGSPIEDLVEAKNDWSKVLRLIEKIEKDQDKIISDINKEWADRVNDVGEVAYGSGRGQQ